MDDFSLIPVNNEEPEEEPTIPEGNVANGDFENGLEGWTKKTDIPTVESGNNNNSSKYFKFWAGSAIEGVGISQKVKLVSGKYVLTAEINGDSGKFPLNAIIKAENKEYIKESSWKTTSWDKWDQVATQPFELSEDTVVEVCFEGNLAAEAWGGIDNVKIVSFEEWLTEQKNSVLSALQTIINTVKDYSASDYTEDSFTAFTENLNVAKEISAMEISTVTLEQLQTAKSELEIAVNGLEAANMVEASIAVSRIDNLPSDFIKGVDVSSYISEKESGVKYYDFDGVEVDDQGFFNLLASSGVNYVRIRVWNNPYDAQGNGYGGGNNDIEKAKKIGLWASNAGMKVLVDFHFSDFWTDPGKQYVPKAWREFTLDEKAAAIEKFAKDNVTYLLDAGVNVGMVQVGNETNAFFCGEKQWSNICQLFSAGSKGVREAAASKEKNILVALHFADPSLASYTNYADNLMANNVDYDVFATSYYEFYHGTIDDMKNTMQTIATKTGEYVMVAETSWASTLEDGDGHENQIRKGGNDTYTWEYSAGGQAAEVRDVMASMAEIQDNKGIGVFYWEPAWIPVQYAYDSDGNLDTSIVQSNKEKWEKYGSGWAASFGGEYQVDAKTWWGGSAMDNQAMFDMSGHPLESLKVFNYVNTGTKVSKKSVSSAIVKDSTFVVDEEITPATATVRYNTGDKVNEVPVIWNETDLENAKQTGVGNYVIRGKISAASVENDTDVEVKWYLTIISKNLLENGSVETSAGWECSDALSIKKENARTGEYSIGFWNDPEKEPAKISGTATTTITLNKGKYCIGAYAQGAEVDVVDEVTQEVIDAVELTFEVIVGDTVSKKNVELKGYNNWRNPQVDLIEIKEDGTVVTIKASIANVADSGWGAWDDFYVYPVHTVKFMSGNTLVSEQNVLYGQSAQTPTCDLPGQVVVSWDGDLKKIKEDTIIQVKLSNSGSGNNSGSTPSTPLPETKPDGSTVETKTETKPDGTKVETKTETKPDGTKVETVTETAIDGSKVETKKESETNTAGKQVDVATVTKTDADGKVASVVEKSTINEVAKNTTATVTVKKDSEGAVTSATASVAATIEGKKTSLSADVIAQVQEASGQKDVAVTVTAKNDEGKTLYKVKVDTKDLTPDNALYIYKVDSKTGELVMVNSKTYKVDENGGLDISIKNKATYELVSKEEAKAIEKQIKATIKVQNSSKDVKKGKTTKVAFDKKMNMNNVKSITYQTADKKIATVSKSGKVTAKAKGTVTVKATVTLKNGSKKTVTMKIKVK